MNKAQALAKIKQNKTMTAIVVIAVLAGLIYFFRDKLFGKKAVANDSFIQTGSPSPSTTSNPSASSGDNTMLQRGSKGEQVKELQRLLNHKQSTSIPDANSQLFLLHGAMQGSLLEVDGIFGAKTEQSLQRWTGLTSITLAQARKALG